MDFVSNKRAVTSQFDLVLGTSQTRCSGRETLLDVHIGDKHIIAKRPSSVPASGIRGRRNTQPRKYVKSGNVLKPSLFLPTSVSARKRAVSATALRQKRNQTVTIIVAQEDINEFECAYFQKYGYNTDDLYDNMYPTDGALTPLVQAREQSPAMGRYSPVKGPRMTPLDGLQNNGRPGRPKSRVRPLGRPQSRVDVSVQNEEKAPNVTEKKSYPPPEPEQFNYAIPDTIARPTSPVQRLLERGQSQPFMSVQGHVPGTQMDPITRQYYHRQWSKQRPTSSTDMSLNRYGRAGGQWRHIRACVANTGSQLAFIDGTVKEEDNVYFPQFGKRTLALSTLPTYPQMYTQHPGSIPKYNTMTTRPNYRSKFSDRAKSGFKYWYQEPKPIDLRGTTTRMRARIVGNGY